MYKKNKEVCFLTPFFRLLIDEKKSMHFLNKKSQY